MQSSDEKIRLYLLGRFEIRAGDEVIIDQSWNRRKAKAVLKLLALQKDRSLHREQVFDVLWPDLGPEAAANNLRKNLHYIRAAFAAHGVTAPIVSVKGDMVVLSPQVRVDVDTFRSLAQKASASGSDPALYEQALAVYTGDLLPEDIYEDWVRPQRGELRSLRIRLLGELGPLCEAHGKVEQAADALQQIIRADPLHEEAHRALMRLYAQAGDRRAALRQYGKCRDVLQSELAVEPSQETEALYREIVEGRLQARASAGPQSVGGDGSPVGAGRDDGGGLDREPGVRGGQEGAVARLISRLWGQKRFRWSAPLTFLALAVIGGGVAGGFVLNEAFEGDGEPPVTAAFQGLVTHQVSEAQVQWVSGDCVSEDIVFESTIEGEVTGDISGRLTATSEATLYAIDVCGSGISKAEVIITDQDGNSLFYTSESPLSIARLVGEGSSGISAISAGIITGGTGIYEGATGRGTCTTVSVSEIKPDGSGTARSESDCTFELSTGETTAATLEPMLVQMGVSSTEVTVFGGSIDLPNRVAIAVLYRNTSNQAQKGLTLKLPVPEGVEILAAARGEEQPISAGERIWDLPDLPPGAIQRYEFTLQFLAVETPIVPLVVEIDGDGFGQPASSYPISITVLQ